MASPFNDPPHLAYSPQVGQSPYPQPQPGRGRGYPPSRGYLDPHSAGDIGFKYGDEEEDELKPLNR